jgi:phosphopantetheinyl transferase
MATLPDAHRPPVMVRCLRLSPDWLRGAAGGGRAARSLGARILLRRLLERTTGLAGALWQLEPGDNGKLLALDSRRQPGPEVSVSHSRDWVAAAVSRVGTIGVDVEVARPTRAIGAIAEMAFGPAERAMVGRDGKAAFYRIWTLREAMAKATGAGLSEAADRCDRVGQAVGHRSWAGRCAGTDWLLHHAEPAAGVHLAVAVVRGDTRWCRERYGLNHGLDVELDVGLDVGLEDSGLLEP